MARAGEVLPVSDSNFHYQLPAGLAAGTLVKLISFDRGYWTVEAEGREYRVFMARIDSGWEYEVKGRWVAKDSVAGRQYG